jgi:hypothetical protein
MIVIYLNLGFYAQLESEHGLTKMMHRCGQQNHMIFDFFLMRTKISHSQNPGPYYIFLFNGLSSLLLKVAVGIAEAVAKAFRIRQYRTQNKTRKKITQVSYSFAPSPPPVFTMRAWPPCGNESPSVHRFRVFLSDVPVLCNPVPGKTEGRG